MDSWYESYLIDCEWLLIDKITQQRYCCTKNLLMGDVDDLSNCQLFYFPSRSETWKWNKTGRQNVFGLRVKVAPYMMVWVPICPLATSNTGSNPKLFYLQEDSHTVLCFHDHEQKKKVYTLTPLFAYALPQTCLIKNEILALIWLIFNIMHVCKRRKQLLKSPQCYLDS